MSIAGTLAVFAVLQAQADPANISITPATSEVPIGSWVQLNAQAFDAAGEVMPGVTFRWFSSDAQVARVNFSGRVNGLAAGRAQILVVVGATSAAVTVVVPPLPPVAIDATLPAGRVPVGASAPLTVTVTDRDGNVLIEPDVAYSSSQAEVARVDRRGRVFGVSPGASTVTIRAGSVSTSVRVEVSDGPSDYRIRSTLAAEAGGAAQTRTGDVVRFSAVGTARGGGEVEVWPAWSVSGSGAQIDAEGPEGVFVAEEPGRYTVTAVMGDAAVRTIDVDVVQRHTAAELRLVGRGPISDHHSGDVWVFEGVDGRDYAYIGTFHYDWMKVWDVTDPSSPVLTDSMQLDARRINDVKIHPNNRVGIVTREGASSRRNGIVVLDLTTPAHPTIMSEYTETVTGGVHNVWIEPNDIVYAAHNGTSDMHILDISDPRNVREVGRWGLPRSSAGKSLHDMIIQSGYAYLSYWNDGVIMLDVGAGTHGGTPTRPTQVSQFKYPIGNTHVAWRSGRYLFIGDELFPPNWNADRPSTRAASCTSWTTTIRRTPVKWGGTRSPRPARTISGSTASVCISGITRPVSGWWTFPASCAATSSVRDAKWPRSKPPTRTPWSPTGR